MNKRAFLNMGGILLLWAILFLISCILLRENMLPVSIDSILSHLNHTAPRFRVIVAGLLPVYVALFIFGIGFLGFYFISLLRRFIK